MSTLFPDAETMDPDAWAAREFVREVSGDPTAELVPGWIGCNFCAIAVSLALATGEGDLEYDALRADPERYADGQGGSSYLFNVDSERVLWPGGVQGSDFVMAADLEPDQVDVLNREGSVKIGAHLYLWPDDDAGWVTRGALVPDDAWGPGAGTVPNFITRYDHGEFPSLQLGDGWTHDDETGATTS